MTAILRRRSCWSNQRSHTRTVRLTRCHISMSICGTTTHTGPRRFQNKCRWVHRRDRTQTLLNARTLNPSPDWFQHGWAKAARIAGSAVGILTHQRQYDAWEIVSPVLDFE